jgi:hypothetical protein
VSDRWVLSSLSRLSTQGARNHLIRRVCRASLRVTASPARSRHENKIVINRCLTVKCHSKEPIRLPLVAPLSSAIIIAGHIRLCYLVIGNL